MRKTGFLSGTRPPSVNLNQTYRPAAFLPFMGNGAAAFFGEKYELQLSRRILISHRIPQPGQIRRHTAGSIAQHAELPAIIAEAANRGLLIFPVSQTSKYAASSLIKARIGDATSDLAWLAEFAAEDHAPAGWAFATGPDAGVFVVEMDGELGMDALNGLIALAIISLQGEELDWQTLSARAGRSTFAIYKYPAGMTLRRSGKHPEPGLTIHGDGGYVLLPPSFVFLNPDISIASRPQLLLDLAFQEVSNEVSSRLARRITPQTTESRFLPYSFKPDAGRQIWGIARKQSPVRSIAGWPAKIRISRRS